MKAVGLALGALFAACLVAGLVMVLAAIWSGDERGGETALVVGGVGFVGGFAVATYPGWDW